MRLLHGVTSLAAVGLTRAAVTPTSSALPLVDLGYERHQALAYNSTFGYYNFANIRYAAPPVGNLRFAQPQPPAQNRGQIQNGSVDRICPQANPAWLRVSSTFLQDYVLGLPFNASAVSIPTSGPAQAQPLGASEDCLFLDVKVPKKIFDGAQRNGHSGYGGWGDAHGKSGLAPVLVWIYGGGYVEGNKAIDPAGLFERSDHGLVIVALNYRLGALGWSAGPTFQEVGTANAGLYDQRFALQWVQKYIHHFGGDKDRVTVFGESAGGGSILHHITAFGGLRGPAPFRAAISQSPGWLPLISQQEQEGHWNAFLELANVTTIEEARQLSSEAVIAVNALQVAYQSGYGNFTYGPAVDGQFVPAFPGELLLHGQFDKSVAILTGHNADEGLLFTPYYLTTETAFRNELLNLFPTIQGYILDYIRNELYPPVYDGSYGYKDVIGRASLLLAEAVFTCNTNYLARAYNNKTYAYRFDIFPALHGEDVAYTFYADTPLGSNPADGVVNKTVAYALQEFITSFAIDLNPTSKTWGKSIPQYGAAAQLVNMNASGFNVQKDDAANQRCDWWQKALYY